MPSHIPPKNSLPVRLIETPLSLLLFLVAITKLLLGRPKYLSAWPFRRSVTISFLRARSICGRFILKHYIGPTTGECIRTWAEQNGYPYSEEVIPTVGTGATCPDATLHRLDFGGQKKDGLVLLYIHGGGFIKPINPKAHLPLVRELCKSLQATTAYILEYDLAPASAYPISHVQAVAALRSILSHAPTDRIVIGGDSAGGNLVASVLAHIQTPSPYTAPLELDGPLAGACLISPYVRIHRSTDELPRSWVENRPYDYLSHESSAWFRAMWHPKDREVWAEPYHRGMPAGFWKGLPVRRILVIAGEWEVLRDDAIPFGQTMREEVGGDVVDVLLTDKGIHVESAVDLAAGIRTGDMLVKLKKWCESVASGQ